jgi:hypothetical protein
MPTSTKKPEKLKKTNTRGIKKDGTPTATAKVNTILKFDSTKARALQAEHIRTLIRQSGCTGVKHENAHQLMYTILFGDETTLLHFRQFQQMWEYRSLSPTEVGPQAEWWTAFRWFLRDCFSKAKAQIGKSGYTLPQTYSDEVGKIMPVIALEGDDKTKGKGRARREAVNEQSQESKPLWPLPPSVNLLPVGGEGSYSYRNDAPPGIGMPGSSGSGPYAYMAVIIDPDKAGHSSRNGVHDLYDPFGAAASRTFTNVASLTLLALFQSVKRLTPDREPRALYGCLARPRNPIGTVEADGVPDPIQEQRARDMEQTYLLRADDTTLLWSDRTVKTFFDTVQKPPWVLVILRRNPDYRQGDTPPRGPQVTLDPVGAVIAAPRMPAAPRATSKTRCDILSAMDRIERMKRRMEEQLRAVNDAATELGLENDPLLIRACKRLRTSVSSPGNRHHSGRNIDDKPRGI